MWWNIPHLSWTGILSNKNPVLMDNGYRLLANPLSISDVTLYEKKTGRLFFSFYCMEESCVKTDFTC